MKEVSKPTWNRSALLVWVGVAILAFGGLLLAWRLVEPPPPRSIRLAAGSPGGTYARLGERYRDLLGAQGLEVEILTTAGSLENLDLLARREADLAFVQGGVATAEEKRGVTALASVYFEPLWVFVRGTPPSQLGELAGKRIAVGPERSGTRRVAVALLQNNGIEEGDGSGSQLVALSSLESARAAREGRVDAIFFVGGAQSELVARLFSLADWELMSFRRSLAYESRHRHLSALVLGEGMYQLESNQPSSERRLLAPAALLAAPEDLHPALIPLILGSAKSIH